MDNFEYIYIYINTRFIKRLGCSNSTYNITPEEYDYILFNCVPQAGKIHSYMSNPN